jgi:CRP/FNR family transcriptional regulator
LCVPAACPLVEGASLDGLAARRISVAPGDTLFEAGDPGDAVFAVRRGSFKTSISAPGRKSQVIGFHMPGDLIGLDGIGTGTHACDATALEQSEVCVIQCDQLEEICSTVLPMQRSFNRLLGSELAREQQMILMLGRMHARARVAAFLADLIARRASRGVPASLLVLRMKREDIGTYLGLTLETVSRCLSQFQREGILGVDKRVIRLKDRQALLAAAQRSEARTVHSAG